MTEVVAALICRAERFLICRRPPHKARGLLWEFVGGKVEPGETGPEALRRECREELGIDVSVGDIYTEVTHRYSDITVHIILYRAEIAAGEPKLLEHSELAWINADRISDYSFCPADEAILSEIVRRGI